VHYDTRLLGHSKLETTALYTRVATNTIREVISPLDRLTPLMAKPGAPPPQPPRQPAPQSQTQSEPPA
jgi:hypothetical protein